MVDKLYHYRVRSFPTVYDGDTCTAEVDVGFHMTARIPCRLAGINAPEMGTPEGAVSRDYLRGLLSKDGIIHSHKRDKYGRWLVTIYVNDVHVNDTMVAMGLAEVYS